jgi:uncharacterized protein YodC (DUF2158 family)
VGLLGGDERFEMTQGRNGGVVECRWIERFRGTGIFYRESRESPQSEL